MSIEETEKKTKNILVITYWSYKDALVQTYSLPYVKIISKYLPQNSTIYFVTLEQAHLALSPEELARTEQTLRANNIQLIRFDYTRFGIKSLINTGFFLIRLVSLIFTKKIDFIHTWCTPAGALGYILSKLTGKPLVLDSYEPHAEASVENGDWQPNSFPFRLLFGLEKRLSNHAKIIIATTVGMRHYAKIKYGSIFKNFFVKPACVDLTLFKRDEKQVTSLRQTLGYTDKIVCVYAGKLGGIYLDQEVFDFFKAAHNYWGSRFSVLLLTNQSTDTLKSFCEKSQLDFSIITAKFVAHSEVAQYMAVGDFGLTPVKSIATKRYCTPIKDGEYWALGLPVVISPNISDDSDIIAQNKIGAIWHYEKKETYIETLKEINTLLESPQKEELHNKIRKIAEKYRSFDIAENIYKTIYNTA
jgi:glycosyltransferase involved in cell wall biosynthesis